MTKEHLPFKALYKGVDKNQNRAAIIKICLDCNRSKSLWDQEFLAVYGHLLDISRAEKAQDSLKKINEVNNTTTFAIIASRTATITGDSIAKVSGIPTDLISQWFSLCGRGIYYYFKRKPFEGVGISIIPKVIDHNISAKNYKNTQERQGFTENIYEISKSCNISLSQQEGQPPLVKTTMVNQQTNRMFSIVGFFIEEESQLIKTKQNNPVNLDFEKPLRFAEPRKIHKVSFKENGGYSYEESTKSK